SAFRCYQHALLEALGITLARLKDEPAIAHGCLTSALAALSAAQAIGRLKSSIDGMVVPPEIAAEGSRLLARLPQTLRDPSVWKLSRRAGAARALGRHAVAAVRGSADPGEIEALNGVVVGAATLASDLVRARMILQGQANAIPVWSHGRVRADARRLVRAVAGSVRSSRRHPDPARLLPAVLARAPRALRPFRLPVLRQRAARDQPLKETPMQTVVRVLLTLVLVIAAALL